VEEIARMLSGQPESEVGREHALDLLEAAADARRLA
jgi:DNA repair ATPase RecN